MQRSYGPAITHVQNGLKILCEITDSEKSPGSHHNVLRGPKIPYVSKDDLEQIFMRLDLRATQVRPPSLFRRCVLTKADV